MVRSSSGSADAEASELVELRFNLHVGSQFNPESRQEGHVQVAWSAHGGLTLEIKPMFERSGSTSYVPSPRAAQLTLEGLTQAWLETQILTALDRVLAQQ